MILAAAIKGTIMEHPPPKSPAEGDMRLPYAALRSEGENACVMGPASEIVLEITHGGEEEQWQLACWIAAMLNDPPNCGDRADKAKHLLLLVRENHIGESGALDHLADAIEEAGAKFSRAEIAELTGARLPF